MDPDWVIWKYVWSEIVMVRCSVNKMDFGRAAIKRMLIGQTDGFRFRNCANWGLVEIGGQQGAHGC